MLVRSYNRQQVDILTGRQELVLSSHKTSKVIMVRPCLLSLYAAKILLQETVDTSSSSCRRGLRKSWRDNIKEWTGQTTEVGRRPSQYEASVRVPKRRLSVTSLLVWQDELPKCHVHKDANTRANAELGTASKQRSPNNSVNKPQLISFKIFILLQTKKRTWILSQWLLMYGFVMFRLGCLKQERNS